MAKINKRLDSGRMNNAQDGDNVAEAHAEFETALAKIFGIPEGVDIRNAIFTEVDSTGGIFLMRYKTETVKLANGSPGIMFKDGNKVKKLTFAGSKIAIWERIRGRWSRLFDYEDVEEPALTEHTDVSIDTMEPNWIVGTTDGEKFVLRPPEAAGDGVSNFIELTEADDFNNGGSPPALDKVGRILCVKSTKKLGAFEDPANEPQQYAWAWATNQTLPLVGMAGNPPPDEEGMALIKSWDVSMHDMDINSETGDQSYVIRPTTFNGVVRGGFELTEPGVYRVRLNCSKYSNDINLAILWKIVPSKGVNYFPPGYNRKANPFYWKYPGVNVDVPADWETSQLAAIRGSTYDPYESSTNLGACYIIASQPSLKFGIKAGTASTNTVNCTFEAEIVRII